MVTLELLLFFRDPPLHYQFMLRCVGPLKLFPKLAIALAVVAVAPIVVFGVFGLGPTSEVIGQRLEQGHAQLAKQAADRSSIKVRTVLASLRQSVSFGDYSDSDEELITGMLRVAYRASDDITIISLVDEQGVAVVPSVYLENPQVTKALRRHPPVSAADLQEHGRHIPLEAALASGAAIGPPYGTSGAPRVALAVEAPSADGRPRVVLVAEMSLEGLVSDLDELGGASSEVILVRPDCRNIDDGSGPISLPSNECHDALPQEGSTGSFDVGGRRYLGAFAPVPLLGWGVVVRQNESQALAPMSRLNRLITYWALIGVAVALFLAGVVARDLSRRIGGLAEHAQALARGDFDRRITTASRDELGDLGEAFNRTARDLEEQREKIEAQNREITAWNEELEQRVEEKTNQLAQAQDAVLRSRRLAGLGVLGAGVAHEINNPLASTLGFIQLALHDKKLTDKNRQSLEEAEKSALRIREIVHELLKLAESESGPANAEVDLNDAAQRAAHMVVNQLVEDEISLEINLATELPPVRGNAERIIEAALHLIHNARQAIEGPGLITLRTSHTGGQLVTLEVVDTGKGIPKDLLDRVFDPFFTTKGSWESRGLGLSVVHKFAEEHGGKLELKSEVGEGTTAILTIPAASGQRHLD